MTAHATDPAARIAVIGDFNIDVILGEVSRIPRVGYDTVSPEYSIEPGGSAAIVALGLAKVGWNTELYANVGSDLFGTYLRDSAKEAGLRLMNCADDRSESTGLSVAFSKYGDRGFVSVPNPISDWNALELIRDDPPPHVHICYHPYLPGLTEKLTILIPELRGKGITVSLDPAGPGPRAADPMIRLKELGKVDFLFLNEQEAGDFHITLPPETHLFEQFADFIVVKRGVNGATAYTKDRMLEVFERSVDELESTGAGDNFAVGFLSSWLKRKDMETALHAGNLFGSESTRYPGGVRVQQSYGDLLASHPELF